MSCPNFKIYAKNKLFIGIFGNMQNDFKDEDKEYFQDKDGSYLYDLFLTKKEEIFGEYEDFVSFDTGYYEGASIGIDYVKLADTFDHNGLGAKKRQELRLKLEAYLRALFAELKEEMPEFDIVGLGLKGVFSNGEAIYDQFKYWVEEI